MMKTINKRTILELTQGGILYYYKVYPELRKAKLNNSHYRNIRNHLRGEKNPSLSCYKRGKKWILHDHADPEYSGDVFTIYSKVNNVQNFTSILRGIYREVTGEEPSDIESEGDDVKLEEGNLPDDEAFTVEAKCFSSLSHAEVEYMSIHGISKEIMESYNASFLNSYTFRARSGKIVKIIPADEFICIGYNCDDSTKIYKPSEKEFKFHWLGEKPDEYVFGIQELKDLYNDLKTNEHNKLNDKVLIVLCAGEKDTMVVNSLGFKAICLNSETTGCFPVILLNLFLRFCGVVNDNFEIVVLYDADETGKKQALNLKESEKQFSDKMRIVELPAKLNEAGGKDVSDWITLGLPKDELIQLIKGDGSNGPSPKSAISDSPLSVNNDDDPQEYEEAQVSTSDTSVTLESSDAIDGYIEKLPSTLQMTLVPFESTDKLMMLMSFITCFGAIIRNVIGMFRNDRIHPNLYTVIVAPPASGKSQIKWARELIKPVEKFIYARSTTLKENFERDLELVKEGQMDRNDLGPEPPFEVLHIPTDITSSSWIQQIADNDGYGLMYDTEIDGLVESNSGSLRSFTDYLRKASEGETLALMRKTNREHVIVEEGKMSILISGTPGQFIKLIPDSENGLFSRMFIVQFEGHPDWIDAFDPDPFDMYAHFEALSHKVLEYYKELDSLPEPIRFQLSLDQLVKLDTVFKQRLKDSRNIAGVDVRATVMRLGVITTKIAMILTTLRRLELNELHNQYECHSDDFDVALYLTDVALQNAIHTLKAMKNDRIERCYRGKKLDYFHALPNNFTYALSQEIAEIEGVKLKTAQKWVYEFRDKGFLVNPEKGEFRKVA